MHTINNEELETRIAHLENFSVDGKAANQAAACLEYVKIPRDVKPRFRKAVTAFVNARMHSDDKVDNIALRCMMRRHVFMQGGDVFSEATRLLKELPADRPENHLELLIALVAFLWVRPPSTVIDEPELVDLLVKRCREALKLPCDPGARVAAVKCLLVLIFMGSDVCGLIDDALSIRQIKDYLVQRCEDLSEHLRLGEEFDFAVSRNTKSLLERVLERSAG